MFFDSSYVDEEALTEADPETGATVSSLLLLPYSMMISGANLGAAYIYGAGTLRKFRAKGHMGRLLKRALREATDRGDSLVLLIPASETLRGYYSRFGFASVFYRRLLRFTSLHRFPSEGNYVDVSSRPAAELFPAYERLTKSRDYCVSHSRAQFLTVMDDVRLSATGFAAIARTDDPEKEPVAMAWGHTDDLSDDLFVTELIASDRDAANAAIMKLKEQFPDRPVTILTPASDDAVGGNLVASGMARIVNPEPILSTLADKNPDLKLTIRLSDPIIEENNATYSLRDGVLRVTTSDPDEKVDLEIDVTTLSAMLFSSAPIAAITGLPAHRPQMSLMLD